MEIETTVATTELIVTPSPDVRPDADGFGTRPSRERPHSMSLSGPMRVPREDGSPALELLLGVGIGAAAMYYFDPDSGSQRRAMAREGIRQALTAAPEILESPALATLARSAQERIVARTLGGLLTLIAARRRDALGAAIGLIGSALLAREAGRTLARRPATDSEMPHEPVPRELGDALERPRLLEEV